MNSRNILLYLLTVIVWGSSWLAIEYQLGDVAIEASLVYRFTIATMIMWIYCHWAKISLRFSAINHLWIFLLALSNFSLNYALIYVSQQHLNSAMTSIAFSTMLLMNIINTRLFFGVRIMPQVYIGAFFGLAGVFTLFSHELRWQGGQTESLLGLSLVLAAALVASFGNMISVRNSRASLSVFAVNAWGMLYGTFALLLFCWFNDSEFLFSTKPSYMLSLLYLAIFGTVIAFATYYVLLRDIGPERASYVIVLFPIVAVLLSSLFEGFIWRSNITIGFLLVLLGNIILLTPPKRLRSVFKKDLRN